MGSVKIITIIIIIAILAILAYSVIKAVITVKAGRQSEETSRQLLLADIDNKINAASQNEINEVSITEPNTIVAQNDKTLNISHPKENPQQNKLMSETLEAIDLILSEKHISHFEINDINPKFEETVRDETSSTNVTNAKSLKGFFRQ